jgi:GNAT superfamily N-acetyltransferase
MTITYQTALPATAQFAALFETTGWNNEYRCAPAELAAALQATWYAVSAYDGSQLVGYGGVISDGVIHALVVNLIVAPAYREQGIGQMILGKLVAQCRTAGVRDIQLFCARGKMGFYEKQGFVARPAEAPGMQFRAPKT